jgi:lipopolysaccharide biosynthesis protein
MVNSPVKVYAYYLPQFHETPENNAWWGKGFTEWNNVRTAVPLYKGHYQPRVPWHNNYYDLSDLKTIIGQSETAKAYGISGFGVYHYWYSGMRLLSRPIDLILENKNLDLNFYLCWANHSWTRCWKNSSAASEVLIKQSYEDDPSQREAHYRYLARVMSDPRYITLGNRCLFQIYQPGSVPNFHGFVRELREYILRKTGRKIHISGIITHNPATADFLPSVDSVTLFQPGAAMYNTSDLSDRVKLNEFSPWFSAFLRNLPDSVKKIAYAIERMKPERPMYLDYKAHWEKILCQTRCLSYKGKPLIPGAFVDFDNTARYKNRAKVFRGASPEIFAHYFRSLVDAVNHQYKDKVILINAWNEWGEGAYLEPDERNGYAYLEAIRIALTR